MELASALNNRATRQRIFKIRDLYKKFSFSCTQLIHINNLIDEIEVRYIRSQQVNQQPYRYILNLKLSSLEGVRDMFKKYAYEKADILQEMQLDLYNRTGVFWSETLADQCSAEDCELM